MTGNSMRYRCNCGGKLYIRETRACEEAIYRVRKCQTCSSTFTTREVSIPGGIPTFALPERPRK